MGAPRVLKSTPAEAVVSFDMIVLLTRLTTSASCRDTPAPSQPATLLAMMLLVTLTEYQRLGVLGKVTTSVPLTPWKRMPPPLPLSAELPMIKLALITMLGPVPSLVPGAQSASGAAPHTGSVSGEPMITIPPPLVAIVALTLWLNRIELCSMSAL